METKSKALGYLGLARRGGRIAVGEEPCGAACRSSHARLLLVAEDAGDHTFRRARSFARTGKPPVLTVPFSKEELGSALGLNACALAALTDAPLALAFVEALGEPERHQAILETLRTRPLASKNAAKRKRHTETMSAGGRSDPAQPKIVSAGHPAEKGRQGAAAAEDPFG